MKSIRFVFILTSFILLDSVVLPNTSQSEPDPLVIIVHNQVEVSELSESEVRRLFLKEKTRWKNGDRVFPINAKIGSKARALFQQKVLRMTAPAEREYWEEQKIRYGKTPPPEFSNIPKAIFSLRGSIGYCLRSEHKARTSKIVLTL